MLLTMGLGLTMMRPPSQRKMNSHRGAPSQDHPVTMKIHSTYLYSAISEYVSGVGAQRSLGIPNRCRGRKQGQLGLNSSKVLL